MQFGNHETLVENLCIFYLAFPFWHPHHYLCTIRGSPMVISVTSLAHFSPKIHSDVWTHLYPLSICSCIALVTQYVNTWSSVLQRKPQEVVVYSISLCEIRELLNLQHTHDACYTYTHKKQQREPSHQHLPTPTHVCVHNSAVILNCYDERCFGRHFYRLIHYLELTDWFLIWLNTMDYYLMWCERAHTDLHARRFKFSTLQSDVRKSEGLCSYFETCLA